MAVTKFFRSVLRRKAGSEVASPETQTPPVPSPSTQRVVTEPPAFSLARGEETYYQYLFEKNRYDSVSVPQKLVIEIVRENMARAELRIKAVPRLPMIIPKLLRSLKDPDSSAKDYVDIINKDPAMSASVLKLSNSAYFNPFGKRVESIEKAVVKLGSDGLRAVLSAAVLQPIVQRESPYFSQTGQRLWQHSLNCAVVCGMIAQERHCVPFKVYLMGLVHDIGKVTLFSELGKQFKLNSNNEQPGYNAFTPIMKEQSAELSYLIARDWQLPSDICVALREQVNLKEGKSVSAEAHLLYQANLACEVYAVTPKNQRKNFTGVLSELQLPADLFERLDQVDVQL